jgi:6-pyruvoyltetrahydropterin/6-carboxytetrahydropterin synthase
MISVDYINSNLQSIKKSIEDKRNFIKSIKLRKSRPLEKVAKGRYLIECILCDDCFVSAQVNPNLLPKLCPGCKDKGGTCILCTSSVRFSSVYCTSCITIAKKTELWNHKIQGKKITGNKNPSKRPEVRKKISRKVKKSWADPRVRRRHMKGSLKANVEEGNYKSKMEKMIALYLRNNNIPFKYEPRYDIEGKLAIPDFVVPKNIAIEVAGWIFDTVPEKDTFNYTRYEEKIKLFLKKFNQVIVITNPKFSGFFSKKFKDDKVTVITMKHPFKRTEKTILIKDNICNIDYSHFLSFHEAACNKFHGHTSWNVGLAVEGYVSGKGMVIDYGDMKKIVKEVVKEQLDHKLVVCSDYVKEREGGRVLIEYGESTDYHRIDIPENEVFIIDEEPTNENIIRVLANQILERMPSNVVSVGLSLSEGVNNRCIYFTGIEQRGLAKLNETIRYHQLLESRAFQKIVNLLSK